MGGAEAARRPGPGRPRDSAGSGSGAPPAGGQAGLGGRPGNQTTMTEGQRTVLVVEDEGDVRRILRLMLEGAGYRVIDTGEPEDVADLAREQRPDLVICDIAMPGMDGYAVLRSLQLDSATTPVVFLSAHRDFSERMRAFRAGVVDYTTKPFSRDPLQKRIERIFDGLARRGGLLPEAGDLEEAAGEAEPEDVGGAGQDEIGRAHV